MTHGLIIQRSHTASLLQVLVFCSGNELWHKFDNVIQAAQNFRPGVEIEGAEKIQQAFFSSLLLDGLEPTEIRAMMRA